MVKYLYFFTMKINGRSYRHSGKSSPFMNVKVVVDN